MQKIIMLLAVFFIIAMPVKVNAAFSVNAGGAILLDAETGQILYEQDADAGMGLASVSKLMPIYVLLDQIRSGKVKWDDTYIVSNRVHHMSRDLELANVTLTEGDSHTIRELYEATLVFSANAAVVGITEFIAGSEEEFMPLIDAKAKELELEQYNFVNATGLNNSHMNGKHIPGTGPNDENVMSAKDVAKVGYSIIQDYPEILEITKLPRKTFKPGTADSMEMTSWNYMLPGYLYEYEGVDGLKTGNTTFAGQCFIGTVERNGERFIAVILNGLDQDGNSNYQGRFSTMGQLFDYGFNEFTLAEQPLTERSLTVDGNTVVAKPSTALKYLTKQGETLKAEAVPYNKVGSVKKNTPVGALTLQTNFLYEPQQVELVATKEVSYASKTKDVTEDIGGFFSDFWSNIERFVSKIF